MVQWRLFGLHKLTALQTSSGYYRTMIVFAFHTRFIETPCATMKPAIALRLHITRPTSRVAEIVRQNESAS
jgi:hypothetical protein